MLRTGPYGKGFKPFGRGLTLRRLEKKPHGVDLGPLAPSLPGRLATKDGTIRLAPERLVGDLERLRGRLVAEVPPLVLIGRRQVRSSNSWMHNYQRLMRGKDRCTLLMHPKDAERHGVASAERVVVRSRVGQVEVPLEVSDEMMPGVVSLPHGWGHGRPGMRLSVAGDHPGASVNDLTDDAHIDAASGNAALNGLPVSVEAVAVG
jgi:anaerobic selenocysteine-containing dehydrogenase